jgi:hypothetical protein
MRRLHLGPCSSRWSCGSTLTTACRSAASKILCHRRPKWLHERRCKSSAHPQLWVSAFALQVCPSAPLTDAAASVLRPAVPTGPRRTVRPDEARQFLKTSLDTTSSFFWSSPCGCAGAAREGVHTLSDDQARVGASHRTHGTGGTHGRRTPCAWSATRTASATHLHVRLARRASEVGDTGAVHQRRNLLARQRDGGDDRGQLAVNGALHLLLQGQTRLEQ